MNLNRGINRIGIVLGIVTALFTLYFGASYYSKKAVSSVDFVFSDSFLAYIRNNYGVEIDKTISSAMIRGTTYRIIDHKEIIGDDALRSILNKYPKLKDQDPLESYYKMKGYSADTTDSILSAGTQIKTVIVGIVLASLAFVMTFYGLRGLYLLINWMIKGFKEAN